MMNFKNSLDFGLSDINPNKSPTEIIKEGAFGGTYFRDIYSNVNKKWYKNSWKEFEKDFNLKNTDSKHYLSNFYDTKINKYGVKCGTSLRFWEDKGWIHPNDPYGWFQWYCRHYLGRRSNDDERQRKRRKNNVTRFKGILIKMIKNKGAKFDDYSFPPKIRQILLHWGYKLTENDLFKSVIFYVLPVFTYIYLFLPLFLIIFYLFLFIFTKLKKYLNLTFNLTF